MGPRHVIATFVASVAVGAWAWDRAMNTPFRLPTPTQGAMPKAEGEAREARERNTMQR